MFIPASFKKLTVPGFPAVEGRLVSMASTGVSVAVAVAGKNRQAGRKLDQIRKQAEKAEETSDAACDEYGQDSPQARTRSSIRPFSIAKMAVLPSTRTASIRWAKRLSCVKPAL